MEFEKELNQIYQNIAQKVNDTIHANWKNIYFQGEVTDGSGRVFWFFNTPEDLDYKYCYFIPDIFGISREDYKKTWRELFDLTNKLQEVFISNEQEAWFSVTLFIDEARKLNVYYDYINWDETDFGPSERLEYFQYKYLNKPPKNEKEKEAFKKIREYERNHSS